jgi:ribosomal protein L29
MLNYAEIAQLSDKDIFDEIENTKNSIFRQKIGVQTKHLKNTHLIKSLKKYLARLLTEQNRRKSLGEKIESSSEEVLKKTKEMRDEMKKAQEGKKKKSDKTKKNAVSISDDKEVKQIETLNDSGDVKVKVVEKKKGFFGRKKNDEDK